MGACWARNSISTRLGTAESCRSHINVSKYLQIIMRLAQMRVSHRSLVLFRILAVLLSLTPESVAQVVKLAQTPAQESKQNASSAPQTPIAPRVGVDESRPLALTLFDSVRL